MTDDALALYRKAIELAPERPPVSRVPRRIPPRAQAPRRGPGRLGQDRRGAEPERQEPGAAGRGPRRLRLPQGGDRAADRGGRARARRLRPAAEAGRAAAPRRAVRRRPRPSSPRPRSWPRSDEEKARGARGPGQERPGGRPARRARSRRCARSSRRGGKGTAAALGAAGPLPGGRRQAPRGRPRRRPGDRGRPAARSRPGRWRRRLRESAGNLADAADAFRRLAEIDRRNRTEYLTGVAKLEARLGRVDAGAQGRPRPARRRAGQPRALRVLRRALLPARQARRGPRRPPPRRPGQPERHQGRPDPGRDPRRPVPDRGGHRDVLAGASTSRDGPRRQARRRHAG